MTRYRELMAIGAAPNLRDPVEGRHRSVVLISGDSHWARSTGPWRNEAARCALSDCFIDRRVAERGEARVEFYLCVRETVCVGSGAHTRKKQLLPVPDSPK